ncbi:type II toxin-antitoxin system Phd/YefM family antitoxin [Gloeobacter morelensis]|uniref:type II toxin-antitoxin system Phd/YefM family antitoxin n=1 Tax=Gloeobacter morelensis TaxID=2907343 RepID=UPI003AB9A4A5
MKPRSNGTVCWGARLAQGEQITITKQGTPVARLVPVQSVERRQTRRAIGRFKESRSGQRLNDWYGGNALTKVVDERSGHPQRFIARPGRLQQAPG